MSIESGMAAINLQMTDHVPRAEYSADTHWRLVEAVTGIPARAEWGWDRNQQARLKFIEAWDYAFIWNVAVNADIFGGIRTFMGHGAYDEGGGDFNSRTYNAFNSEDDALSFDPMAAFAFDRASVKEMFTANYNAQKDTYKHSVTMTGVYITCMSGLIDLFGWDMLLRAAGSDPEGFGQVAGRYGAFMRQYFNALAETDIPVVMAHDDLVWTQGAFIHPDWYRRYIFPHYKSFFQPLTDSGKKVLFTSDGNYTEFIDDIAAAGVHGFIMEPFTDMAYVAEKYGGTHSFAGNADTRVLLNGTKDDIYNEVKRCMDIGKRCPGFIMAVGNHIPANTPVDSCLYYDEAVRALGKR